MEPFYFVLVLLSLSQCCFKIRFNVPDLHWCEWDIAMWSQYILKSIKQEKSEENLIWQSKNESANSGTFVFYSGQNFA